MLKNLSSQEVPTMIRKMVEVSSLVYRADTEDAIKVYPTGKVETQMGKWHLEVVTAPLTPPIFLPARELRFTV